MLYINLVFIHSMEMRRANFIISSSHLMSLSKSWCTIVPPTYRFDYNVLRTTSDSVCMQIEFTVCNEFNGNRNHHRTTILYYTEPRVFNIFSPHSTISSIIRAIHTSSIVASRKYLHFSLCSHLSPGM